MVTVDNGQDAEDRRLSPALPELVVFSAAESRRIPSPGTMRALKAETGRNWDEFMGDRADSADRFQTMIWMKLRRSHPGLRWEQCGDIEIEIEDSDVVGPPSAPGPVSSVTLPGSAASGG